jgi:hypothetical protein
MQDLENKIKGLELKVFIADVVETTTTIFRHEQGQGRLCYSTAKESTENKTMVAQRF